MIEEYLVTEEISLTVLLLDIRRIPNEDDVIMYDYFKAMGKDILIVLTKADKLSNNQKFNQVRKIKQSLELREQDQVITFSAETMENRDKVLDIIGENVSRYQNG
jgi:GTP-binding protein